MCEVAPFQMECACEKHNARACNVHKLNCVITEIKQAIPIIGKYIPSYRCPDFEIKAKIRTND